MPPPRSRSSSTAPEIALSAAVGSCRVHSADPADVLREADQRMYETKRRTTNGPGSDSAGQ